MDWADLDTPLVPVPLFAVEAPDRDSASELARVVAFRKAMRNRAPACRVVAIPNAAARGQKALNQVRAEGAAWGFPDLMVLHAGRVALIEFKNGTSKPSDHQTEWLNYLHASGFPCGVFRTARAACNFLASVGFPIDDEVRDAA